ncbi:MAG: discoidin domain-containing protein, partial [Planctomycetota bacterium]
WELRDGEAVCVRQDLPYRTLHLLSARRAASAGDLRASVEVSLPDGVANAFAGIWLGAGSPDLDPRANALVQMAGGREGGVAVGVDATGRASVRILDGRADSVAPPAPPGTLPRRGWRVVRVDSAEPDQPGSHVLDGDPSTIWHTEFRAKRPSHPHEIVIDMGAATEIAGLVYVPRHPEVPGRIDAYGIEVADSAYGPWRLVADGRFPNQPEPQQVRFEATTCRAFRLTAGSAHLDRPSTTVAELYALAPGTAPLPTRTTPPARVRIDVVAAPDGVGTSRVELTVRDAADGTTVDVTAQDGVPDRLLAGSIAVCCDTGGRAEKGATFRFASLRVEGSRVEELPDNRFGPIGGTQYTRSRGVVKLTAQMLPIGDDEPREVALQLDRGQGFETVATAPILQPGYTATFRVDGLGAADTIPYRVCYPKDAPSPEGTFDGTIQAEPAVTAPVVVAGFTGNHMVRHGFGRNGFPWDREGLWFPHDDLESRVRARSPDLLFFSGDQIYEGGSPTKPEKGGGRLSELDYLYKWYLWVWAWRGLTRDLPTITIPDDHDVYQGNVWGAGGRATRIDSKGGYVMSAEWVRMVDRTQTSHLPDPFDPTPIGQGIGVYYTSLRYGGVDLAILEDRKFKSGPFGIVPATTSGRPDHVVDPDFDPATADVPGAALLGARQEAFLDAWARDWAGGTRLKMTVSQTVFGGLATHHGGNRQYLVADYDSNGWPQAGRRRALEPIRAAGAFMLGGDQHLATLCWHGLDDWRDAGWSFAVPSVANFYPRAWLPPAVGDNRVDGAPDWSGDHVDGFGNRVSVFAATNPRTTGYEPAVLHDGMPGFGVVQLNPAERTFTVECWPRASGAPQYEGWPRTLKRSEMDGRTPTAWLPPFLVEDVEEPVVRVMRADGSLWTAFRAPTPRIEVGVDAAGDYFVEIGDGDGAYQTFRATAGPRRAEAAVRRIRVRG